MSRTIASLNKYEAERMSLLTKEILKDMQSNNIDLNHIKDNLNNIWLTAKFLYKIQNQK